MSDSPIHRFLGGSPSSVIIRLIVISLIVGAAMVFFDLTPRDVVDSLRRLIESILGSGLESLRTILVYIAYGAIIVVPIFLVVRLIRMGRG
jgi:Family of unknown function (DUF6460)